MSTGAKIQDHSLLVSQQWGLLIGWGVTIWCSTFMFGVWTCRYPATELLTRCLLYFLVLTTRHTFPAKAETLPVCAVYKGSRAKQASYPAATVSTFTAGKANNSPIPNAEVTNAWTAASSPPYVFITSLISTEMSLPVNAVNLENGAWLAASALRLGYDLVCR